MVNVCLTGSPKPNWKTKSEFLTHLRGSNPAIEFTEVKIKDSDILITDNPNKRGSKIDYARKNNKHIMTYTDVVNKFKLS